MFNSLVKYNMHFELSYDLLLKLLVNSLCKFIEVFLGILCFKVKYDLVVNLFCFLHETVSNLMNMIILE